MGGGRACAKCGGDLELRAGGSFCPRCALRSAFEDDARVIPPASSLPSRGAVPAEVLAAPADHRIGRYVRTARLGDGGMGEVWQAWDTELERWVALKFVKGGSGEDVERLRREARTTATLSHPNIAPVFEVGEEGGRHFIAMRLIEGRTMRGWPRGDRAEVVALVRDAARAVAHANDRGIVHRDLKPDNLMVERGPAGAHVWVMDFGLARVVSTPSGFSVTGIILGTPAYMSPEQAAGDPADARSDVYSLGATLFDLLTGRPPFEGKSSLDVLLKVRQDDPPRLRELDATLEPDLETIVAKCLEKEAGRRYSTVGEVADELDRWLRHDPIRARPASIAYRARKAIRRHRAPVAVGAVALVLVVTAASFRPASEALARSREAAARSARESDARRRLAGARERLARGEAAAARDEALAVASMTADGAAIPVAQAHAVAAQALELLGKADEVHAETTRAWISGAASADPGERAAAAEALFLAGRIWEARGELSHARGAWRSVVSRFPDVQCAPDAAFFAARASMQLGELSTAFREFSALVARPGLDPSRRQEAEQRVDLLRHLASVREFALPPGHVVAARLHGGSPPRLVALGRDGALQVLQFGSAGLDVAFESRLAAPQPSAVWVRAFAADLDGDGSDEILATWDAPRPELSFGGLRVLRRRDHALEAVADIPLKSSVVAALPVDLDGDGRRELVFGTQYEDRTLQVWSLSGPSPQKLFEHSFGGGSDVFDIRETGVAPGDLLVSFGGWKGWRLWRARWQPEAKLLAASATSPDLVHARSLVLLAPGRFAIANWWPEDHARAAGRLSPAHRLEPGLYEVTCSREGGLEAPRLWMSIDGEAEVERAAPARVAGRDMVVLQSRRVVEGGYRPRIDLVPVDAPGAPVATLTLEPEVFLGTADFDGDGDLELATTRSAGGGGLIRVHGWGGAVADGDPARVEGDAASALAPGRDLLAAGLFDGAADACARIGDWVGAGLARMEQGRFADAADLLGRAAGSSRTEALRHLAACLRRLRDWPRLCSTLQELCERPDLDPLERRQGELELQAAHLSARLVPRAEVRSLAFAPGLRAENPCLVRAAGEDLEFLVGKGYRTCSGLPFVLTGGPFRARWSMKIEPHVLEASPIVGFRGARDRLGVACFLSATASAPSEKQALLWDCEPSWSESTPERDNRFETGSDWFDVEIEYAPSVPILHATFSRGGSRYDLDLHPRGPLTPGAYVFGPFGRRGESAPTEQPTVVVIRNLAFESSDLLSGLRPASPGDDDPLGDANGLLAKGRAEEALALYGRAGSASPREHPEAAFFAAVALHRLGRAPDAREALRTLRAAAPADAGRLLSESWAGLSGPERDFFRE
ncbi:MAG: protein kinase [Planctomycetia bacterium]|nr:protein kinase [Planctomycetia bacterium]